MLKILKKKITSLFFSELKFLKSFKGRFFLENLSEEIFFLHKTLDFGLKNSLISNFIKTINNFRQYFNNISRVFDRLKKNLLNICLIFICLVLVIF